MLNINSKGFDFPFFFYFFLAQLWMKILILTLTADQGKEISRIFFPVKNRIENVLNKVYKAFFRPLLEYNNKTCYSPGCRNSSKLIEEFQFVHPLFPKSNFNCKIKL